MDRSFTVLVLEVEMSSIVDKSPHDIFVTIAYRQVQRNALMSDRLQYSKTGQYCTVLYSRSS